MTEANTSHAQCVIAGIILHWETVSQSQSASSAPGAITLQLQDSTSWVSGPEPYETWQYLWGACLVKDGLEVGS